MLFLFASLLFLSLCEWLLNNQDRLTLVIIVFTTQFFFHHFFVDCILRIFFFLVLFYRLRKRFRFVGLAVLHCLWFIVDKAVVGQTHDRGHGKVVHLLVCFFLCFFHQLFKLSFEGCIGV